MGDLNLWSLVFLASAIKAHSKVANFLRRVCFVSREISNEYHGLLSPLSAILPPLYFQLQYSEFICYKLKEVVPELLLVNGSRTQVLIVKPILYIWQWLVLWTKNTRLLHQFPSHTRWGGAIHSTRTIMLWYISRPLSASFWSCSHPLRSHKSIGSLLIHVLKTLMLLSFQVHEWKRGEREARDRGRRTSPARGASQSFFLWLTGSGVGGLSLFNVYVALSRSSRRDTVRLLRDFEDKVFFYKLAAPISWPRTSE